MSEKTGFEQGSPMVVFEIAVPNRILAVARMQLLHVARHVPVGTVKRGAGVSGFLAMVERTPPILNRFDQVGMPLQHSNAHGTV
jgi:hypothetical protein